MIIGWIRLAVFGFLGLTVIYLLVYVYARSLRREALEERFDAGGIAGDRDTYIRDGMARYDKGLWKRLLLLIYIIPTGVVVALIYILNFA